MKKSLLARWRTDFVTGLAVVLPGIVSIAVIVWLFGTVSRFTDTLLFFLPKTWTHANQGAGAILWYWSLTALTLAVLLVGVLGRLTRYYVGKKIVELLDRAMLHIPLLNKIYPFPHPGQHAIGFLTGADYQEVQEKTGHAVLSVFVPTTPNPTSGFLMMVPESEVIKLEMSVADGIKLIISLGAVAPEYLPRKLPSPHARETAEKPR